MHITTLVVSFVFVHFHFSNSFYVDLSTLHFPFTKNLSLLVVIQKQIRQKGKCSENKYFLEVK